jgi:hypothetical protein
MLFQPEMPQKVVYLLTRNDLKYRDCSGVDTSINQKTPLKHYLLIVIG